jgi:hypothetical protein
MDHQLDRILCLKYPSLLLTEAPSNCDIFLFECDDGWFNLIDAVFRVIDRRASTEQLTTRVVQVKEKFGTLRIYCIHTDKFMTAAIEIAELISETTCEICGNVGKIVDVKGWNKVRCCNNTPATEVAPNAPVIISEEYSSILAEAIEAILGLFDSKPELAREWLMTSWMIPGCKKPREMMQTSEGCSMLINFIARLEYGVLP